MGVLADFFTCAAADVVGYADSIGKPAASKYQRVELKGFTSIELETLWAILEERKLDRARHVLKDVKAEPEEWIYEFPEAYVTLLAGLKGEGIAKAGAAWAATEDLDWEPAEGEWVLTELVRIAGAARAKKQGLYFWGSL
jgi:hypothetical protein